MLAGLGLQATQTKARRIVLDALSIIKSRGTAHSNQVRELILSNAGVTLADIFTAGGEVLMDTMRWQKESAELNGSVRMRELRGGDAPKKHK
jgi:hypothetical protein